MMRKPSFPGYYLARGFTLIESIVVLIVLAIGVMGIATLSGNIFSGQSDNKNLQIGMQLAQECAEHVLATGRAPSGFTVEPSCASLPSGMTSGMTFSSLGFNPPQVTEPDGPSGYTGAACPSGGTCRLVKITVSTTGGDTMSPLTVLLVK